MNLGSHDIKKMVLVVVTGLIVIFGYYGYRSGEVQKKHQDLRDIRQKINVLQRSELKLDEMRRNLGRPTDLVDFIGELYDAARSAELLEHEITTSALQQVSRNTRRRRNNSQNEGLKKSRVQINLAGGFRNIASYLRDVQSIDQFKQIAYFELSPDEGSARMVLLIDLFQTVEGESP